MILSALGQHDQAVATAGRALALSPISPYAYLIRARSSSPAADRDAAFADVERGLAVRLNEPGLIELHGTLLHAAGDPHGAIQDYDRVIGCCELDGIHARKAAALVAIGKYKEAIVEWSMALRRDPELPEAFLGRARTHILLGNPDMALADLEQAAGWAHSDPRIEVAIVAAYLRCLGDTTRPLPAFRQPGPAHGVRRLAFPRPPGASRGPALIGSFLPDRQHPRRHGRESPYGRRRRDPRGPCSQFPIPPLGPELEAGFRSDDLDGTPRRHRDDPDEIKREDIGEERSGGQSPGPGPIHMPRSGSPAIVIGPGGVVGGREQGGHLLRFEVLCPR